MAQPTYPPVVTTFNPHLPIQCMYNIPSPGMPTQLTNPTPNPTRTPTPYAKLTSLTSFFTFM